MIYAVFCVFRASRAERALDKAYRKGEQRVEERTAGLSNINRLLKLEIAEPKRAEGERTRNLQQINTLHEINLAVNSSLDLSEILDILMEKVDRLLPYSAVTI